jgi:hypothetical protein
VGELVHYACHGVGAVVMLPGWVIGAIASCCPTSTLKAAKLAEKLVVIREFEGFLVLPLGMLRRAIPRSGHALCGTGALAKYMGEAAADRVMSNCSARTKEDLGDRRGVEIQ